MVRWWLGVALVIMSAAPMAQAEKEAARECTQLDRLPHLDETDVPTNAQVIEVSPWRPDKPLEISSLGDLEPKTYYRLDSPIYLRFKTGPHPDVTPPAAPANIKPHITVTSDHRVNVIDLPGDYQDGQSRVLEIEIDGPTTGHLHTAVAVGGNPHLSGFRGTLAPGHATVKVWSLDLAANRSEPFVGETDIVVDGVDANLACDRHTRCGMGAFVALILEVAGLGLILLLVLAVAAIRRGAANRTEGEHVSIPLGESVARITRRRNTVRALIGFAALVVLHVSGHQVAAIAFSPIELGLLFALFNATRIVARFEHPVNRLERRGSWLLVDHTLLHCGRRTWARASKLPAATVRSLVTLALVLGAATHANATGLTCEVPTDLELPTAGAVPRNALAWNLPYSGELREDQAFKTGPLTSANVTFTDDVDRVPPARPAPYSVKISDNSLAARDTSDLQVLALDGQYDRDTAVVLVDIVDHDNHTWHLATTPSRLYLCSYGYALRPGLAHVSITAVDLAGHLSSPFETNVEIQQPTRHHHFRCGTGLMGVILLVPFVLAGLLVILLVTALVRRTRIRNTPGEVISLLLAENVARIVAHNYLIKSALGVLSVIALLGSDYDIFAILVAPFALLWLCKLVVARHLIGAIEKPAMHVERREDWLYVDKHLLQASRRSFNAAERARVPSARST